MCPLVTTSLQEQQQAASSGVSSLPQIGQIKKFTVIVDEFSRNTVNPTNAVDFYTTSSNDGNGTSAIDGRLMTLTTDGSAIGDDVNVRIREITLHRASQSAFIDSRNTIKIEIIFNTNSTGSEGFIGVINSPGALTALPTTVRHMGIEWDDSASANYLITSADGTTQVTTDTGIAAPVAAVRRILITWTGIDTAIIEFFSSSENGTPTATQTVTSLSMLNRVFVMHFFVQTESTATKTLVINEWKLNAL